MSKLRKAAAAALEAYSLRDYDFGKYMEALRAALVQQEEPVQEPVAWIQPDHLQKARIAPFLCRVEPTQRFADFVPLYLVPTQRKPLTEEEIYKIYNEFWRSTEAVDFARAIERAHGIGEQP